MRQGAARHEPRHPRCRILAAPDGGAGRRRRRARAAPENRRPRRDGAYGAEHGRHRRRAGRRRWPPAHAVRRRHASRHRHDRLLGRYPPARLPGARMRHSDRPARRHRHQQSVPDFRPRRLRHRRMRAVEWPDLRPRRAGLRHGARRSQAPVGRACRIRRCRHEHQIKTDGCRRRQHRRHARQGRRQPQLPVHRRAQTDLQENRRLRLRQISARRRDGRRRSEYGTLLQMMLNRIELPEAPEFLILPQSDGQARSALGVDALPATAQICSCNDVSKGALCEAVAGGATSIGALKSCTKAGTACGGCVPFVTQIMKSEMKKLGMAVNNHVCEHFAYSRQELYHLVRVGKIESFGALLARHGKGLGCEVCKPVAASILASCWNDFVLKKEHASLQDTNDYFLGNIQKDGTYSVVPRMAGGEVTADGLIAVGMVAKKYGLYTKITGGQRVDLFGARVEQLPLIWEELIAAGFESGHAYGKSLRTVKSCVGSTWCRFGVADSLGFAIELENRYKGLRTPHKIKFGVSGCTRECAEAQGKDVGIIATEKGWNLYVCGNGGMKPRHAELLAADLDKETLVRYIDRFLMFYTRTADRLQRTSVWRDNLEGGLEYLKQVVVADKLHLAAELEAEMQHVVDTYVCEWKAAVENPETRKRFRHFVNSDQGDSNVLFMEERGQIRPATFDERKRVIPIAVGTV